MPFVVSVSGARGVVGNGLTPDLVARLAAAHATFCGGGPIAIGRDSRISGPLVLQAAASGVRAVGADVLDLGIVPTPTESAIKALALTFESMKPKFSVVSYAVSPTIAIVTVLSVSPGKKVIRPLASA